jgi:methyl coenzyme M reductase subunit C
MKSQDYKLKSIEGELEIFKYGNFKNHIIMKSNSVLNFVSIVS